MSEVSDERLAELIEYWSPYINGVGKDSCDALRELSSLRAWRREAETLLDKATRRTYGGLGYVNEDYTKALDALLASREKP